MSVKLSSSLVIEVQLVCALCPCCLALRYTTTDGQWKESAIRLTNVMVNVHAIISHFNPKIESWTTTRNLSSLTEQQVSFSVSESLSLSLSEFQQVLVSFFELFSHS